jgi:hypothetical protein
MGMQVALHFLSAHWLALLIAAAVLAVCAFVQVWARRRYGPKDTIGNGITIGHAKAFDNRSLALRIERLSASLDQLKVVNQNVTENASTFQKQTSTQATRSLTLEVKSSLSKAPKEGSSKEKDSDKDAKSDTRAADAAKSESKPAVGLAASDILSDQLNLASQILNLETLYERSLSDRLINDSSRLQTVLGFQVSITPLAGCENSVAVTEVAVRMKDSRIPVSLVALIPQEKTYNAQTVSSSAQSIGGSAVASVLTLGFSSKGESRQLFIHRDSDTIAFERNPRCPPTLFDGDCVPTVFGWEFRPVLGRSTVSAGTRQMLAVIAVPIAESANADEIKLEIRTRSYWRRYNPKKQTSRGKWAPLPWRVDRSRRVDSDIKELAVPNTAKIQNALAPKVTEIKWVNSGVDRATVIVKGANFFSGTKVVTGGSVHREEDGSLVLKSDQALEFETAIESLAKGDSVLSGRFGSSLQLMIPPDRRPVTSLEIMGIEVEPSVYTKESRISIEVRGLDANGVPKDLFVEDIQKLPEPILFVGSQPVPMPYDYYDNNPSEADAAGNPRDGAAAEVAGGVTTNGQPTAATPEGASDAPAEATANASTPVEPTTANYIRVAAWIPKTLSKSPSVAFRVPFCGFEYQASMPLSSFDEPTITRMGADATTSVFRIAHPTGFSSSSSVSVQLDQIYGGPPELTKTSDFDFEFRIATDIVSQYQSLVVRIGSREPYLLPIPMGDTPKPKPKIDISMKPPEIKKGSLGPVEWSGAALDAITGVTLYTNAPQPSPGQPVGATQRVGIAAQLAAYNGGKKIEVYFREGSTDILGKAEVEFQTDSNETVRVPLFIVKDVSD